MYCLAGQTGALAFWASSLFSGTFMETWCFSNNLLVGLLLSGIFVRSSFGFPPRHFTQHALPQRPQLRKHTVQQQQQQQLPSEAREQVNTVSVTCHPDSLEIVIKADLFGVGAPVDGDELRLGVEHNDFCRATASSGEEYRIIVGLLDCGTKHWVTLKSDIYYTLWFPVLNISTIHRWLKTLWFTQTSSYTLRQPLQMGWFGWMRL